MIIKWLSPRTPCSPLAIAPLTAQITEENQAKIAAGA
jgi:hypothetical protein